MTTEGTEWNSPKSNRAGNRTSSFDCKALTAFPTSRSSGSKFPRSARFAGQLRRKRIRRYALQTTKKLPCRSAHGYERASGQR